MSSNYARHVRYAVRVLVKNPGFTTVAIVTLALGIGANTAIFTVANALLLRPLPYPQPDRLVLLSGHKPSTGLRGSPLSWPRFEWINRESRSFSGVAAFTSEVFNLSGMGDPEQISSARVSWNFFEVLGVRPALGPGFRREEDKPGGDAVILISHTLAGITRSPASFPAASTSACWARKWISWRLGCTI